VAQRTFFLLLVLAAGPLQAGDLYRWVDKDGTVHYTDTLPPPSAKRIEEKNLTPSVIQTTGLPYAARQAAKNFPVTLYVSDCGETCDQAKKHLTRRGVPFTSKNADDPTVQEEMRKAFGGLQVPVLVIGGTTAKGYEASAWDAALDAAGYPNTAFPRAAPPTAAP
jgi:glutaredoxin